LKRWIYGGGVKRGVSKRAAVLWCFAALALIPVGLVFALLQWTGVSVFFIGAGCALLAGGLTFYERARREPEEARDPGRFPENSDRPTTPPKDSPEGDDDR
jgi:hypothetical protein